MHGLLQVTYVATWKRERSTAHPVPALRKRPQGPWGFQLRFRRPISLRRRSQVDDRHSTFPEWPHARKKGRSSGEAERQGMPDLEWRRWADHGRSPRSFSTSAGLTLRYDALTGGQPSLSARPAQRFRSGRTSRPARPRSAGARHAPHRFTPQVRALCTERVANLSAEAQRWG